MFDPIALTGLAAAFCTTLSFVPQVVQILKSGDTAGISLGMYALFTLGAGLWITYGLLREDLPVYLANGVTLLLCLAVLGLTVKGRLQAPRRIPTRPPRDQQ